MSDTIKTIRNNALIGFNSTANRERRLTINNIRPGINNNQAMQAINLILDGNAIAYGNDFSEKLESAKFCRIVTTTTNTFNPSFFE